jgi:membrane-bound metal-dependent hydrolase YbcI (DUF457 family)
MLIGGSLVGIGGVLAGLPAEGLPAGIAAGWMTSRLPDELEKRWPLRGRVEHRHETHTLWATLLAVGFSPWMVVLGYAGAAGRGRDERTWARRGLLVILATAAWAYYTQDVLLGVCIVLGVTGGYLGHLLADACTPHGIQPLLPLSKWELHLLPAWARVRTGGALEGLVTVLIVLGDLAFGLHVAGVI